MTCKGQIAEQNANEHVLAIAPQGNLQLSPNFFWNFSHHIRMFLTLRQGFLTIFWIFQTGLVDNKYIAKSIYSHNFTTSVAQEPGFFESSGKWLSLYRTLLKCFIFKEIYLYIDSNKNFKLLDLYTYKNCTFENVNVYVI